MSSEVKLIAYALILLGVIGTGWIAYDAIYHRGETYVQAQWDADKAARNAVLVKAQADALIAQKARDLAVTKGEEDHEKLTAANKLLSTSLDNSVRNLEAAFLRIGSLSRAVGHSSQPAAGGADAAADPELADAVGSVDRAFKEATDGALANFANLTAILAIAPK